MNIRKRLYLSTIGEDAAVLAREKSLGLEVAEFCTAFRMDREFSETDRLVRREMEGIDRFLFHAPFNELCPAAVDPLAVELAEKRFRQAVRLAASYGIRRLIVHSGYIPPGCTIKAGLPGSPSPFGSTF